MSTLWAVPTFDLPFDPHDLAYAAGLIDGEGCFSVVSNFGKGNRPTNYYINVQLRVSMTSYAAVKWLYETFGGSFRPKKVKGNRKPQWTWATTGHKTASVAGLLLPYFKVKKEQAALILACREYLNSRVDRPSGRGLYLQPEDVAQRKQFALRMRELNQKGTPCPTQ